MKITPPQNNLVPLKSESERTAASPTRMAGKPAEVRLSAEVQQLQQAHQQLAQLPEVDMDKVAQLRQAIADNRLPLDLDALSHAIMEFHRW